MLIHSFDPVLINFGFMSIRWYSLAYIFGILFGWWYGKKIIIQKFKNLEKKAEIKQFDDLITYLIISMIVGGRLGYVIFYNFSFYTSNPIEIIKIWEGGMSFHGGLIGIIIGTYLFSLKTKTQILFFLDVIACVSPIGIFLGRIANFINGELIGKVTSVPWAIIFPSIDMAPRHPSQIYEAFLEGVLLFYILRFMISKKGYKIGTCSYMFLILYGIFRSISEYFREPDAHIGYLFGVMSTGTFLSLIMIIAGLTTFNFLKK